MHDRLAKDDLGGVKARLPWRSLAFPALIAGNLCLGFGPWLVRLADVGPVAAGFWRLAIAAPLLVLVSALIRQPVTRVPAKLWLLIGAAGLFFAADLASWHAGILRTRLANAALFGNIASFTFAAYGFYVARTLPHRFQVFSLVLAAVGVALLLGRSLELSPQHALGDLLCITAGLLYTGYLVVVDRSRGAIAPMPMLAISSLAGVLPLFVFASLIGERLMPQDWTPLILLAIGSQVAGQGLLVFAMGYLPPVLIGIALLLQLGVGVTIGWIGYGEALDGLDVLGITMIAIALVLVRRKPPLSPVPESA